MFSLHLTQSSTWKNRYYSDCTSHSWPKFSQAAQKIYQYPYPCKRSPPSQRSLWQAFLIPTQTAQYIMSHLHHHSSNTKVLELYYLPCSHALHNKDSRRWMIAALDTVIEPLWASKLLAPGLLAHRESLLEIVLYWTISRCVPMFKGFSGIVRASRLNWFYTIPIILG